MSYTPNPPWVDGASGDTPIEAAPLNHLEAGVLDASDRLDALADSPFAVAAQYMQIGPVFYSFTPVGPNSAYSVVDKGNVGSDASTVYRDSGAIRAEVGNTADDDFHVKTVIGPAGSETFIDALIVKNASPNIGKVYIPVALGVGTVPAVLFHVAGSSTSGRVATKIENTNSTTSTSAGAQLEFTGHSAPVDWVCGTDFGKNGGNNFFIQDANSGVRFFVDGSGRAILGDSSSGVASSSSLDVVGSIRTRGTNYSLGSLNFCGALTATGAPTAGTYAVGDVVMDSGGTFYRCTVAGTPGTWVGGSTNALSFNVARNYKASATGTIAGGSLSILTDTANGAFTSADVGKIITVVGAGAAGVDLATTISAVNSATSISLTTSASTAVAGTTYRFGTDDGPVINAAITAAATLGGTVSLPPGSYAIGTSIVPANNVRLEGSSWGSTVLYPFGAVACISKLATSGSPLTNSHFARFCIDGVAQVGPYSTGIKGIFIQYMSQCTIEDVLVRNTVATGIGTDFLTNGTVIQNCIVINCGRLNTGLSNAGGTGIGIGTGQHTVEDFTIADCYASSNARYGIMLESQTGTTSRGMRIIGCRSVSNVGHGFGDAGGSYAQFVACTAESNGFDGFVVDNGTVGSTAQPGGNTFYLGCQAIANSRYGFTYNPTATNGTSAAGAGNIKYKDCVSQNNTSLGWFINPLSGHPVSGISLQGCDAIGNGASGIQVSAALNDLTIKSCNIQANGQSSSTSKTGINFAAGNITNLQVVNNKIWDDGATQKQTYAVVVASGVTLTTVDLRGNDLRGNLTGTVNMGGTWSAAILDNNAGYAGSTTAASGPSSAYAIRRDTWANWVAANPTLGNGEMAYETDNGFYKIGDGATAYIALPYVKYPNLWTPDQSGLIAATADGMILPSQAPITTARPMFFPVRITRNVAIANLLTGFVNGSTAPASNVNTYMALYACAGGPGSSGGALLGQTAEFSANINGASGNQAELLQPIVVGGVATPIAAQPVGAWVYMMLLSGWTGTSAQAAQWIASRLYGTNFTGLVTGTVPRVYTNSSGSTSTTPPSTVPTLAQSNSNIVAWMAATQ